MSLSPGSGGWHWGVYLYYYYWIKGGVVYCRTPPHTHTHSLSTQSEQVIMASWLSHRGPAKVEEVCLSWSLHQIEVSIFLPSEIPKAVPRWIHFTPGNSFLSMWVHGELTGRRGRHGTFKPPSNNGFVISQQTAASSQSQTPPFSNFISSAASPFPSLSSCLPVCFPPWTVPPISLCFPSRLYLWQLQTLLAVIGYSSHPWNEMILGKKKSTESWTTHIRCNVKPASTVSVNVACYR